MIGLLPMIVDAISIGEPDPFACALHVRQASCWWKGGAPAYFVRNLFTNTCSKTMIEKNLMAMAILRLSQAAFWGRRDRAASTQKIRSMVSLGLAINPRFRSVKLWCRGSIANFTKFHGTSRSSDCLPVRKLDDSIMDLKVRPKTRFWIDRV